MAIHLILSAANKIAHDLTGCVAIYLDCLGALGRVSDLPKNRIPNSCKHSDILKTIMVNCSNLTFLWDYYHVRGHQDDQINFHTLTRLAQLNYIAHSLAKKAISELGAEDLVHHDKFPLELVAVYVEKKKMTSDTAKHIRFCAHKILARASYNELGILFPNQFDKVDWFNVYEVLCGVPKMFNVCACKQVMNCAPTNANQALFWKNHDPKYLSCCREYKTGAHVLVCKESGRVDALQQAIDNLGSWLEEHDTDPDLAWLLVQYT